MGLANSKDDMAASPGMRTVKATPKPSITKMLSVAQSRMSADIFTTEMMST